MSGRRRSFVAMGKEVIKFCWIVDATLIVQGCIRVCWRRARKTSSPSAGAAWSEGCLLCHFGRRSMAGVQYVFDDGISLILSGNC